MATHILNTIFELIDFFQNNFDVLIFILNQKLTKLELSIILKKIIKFDLFFYSEQYNMIQSILLFYFIIIHNEIT